MACGSFRIKTDFQPDGRAPWLRGCRPGAEMLAAAAAERGGGYAARKDRPKQRRSGEVHSAGPRVSAQVRGLTLREADGAAGKLEFRGLATVYERGYEMWDFWGPYTEIVSAGAGADSLARSDLDVPLVLQHQDLRRIARTTNGSLVLGETDEGLDVHAPELDADDYDVRYIAPKLRAGLLDEMSFKFRIEQGQWSPDYMEYRINAYDIHRGDVAIVGYGANPHTAGAGLRSADPLELVKTLDDEQARALRDALNARLAPPPTPDVSKTPRPVITDDDVRERLIR
jgi:HK97 family phage prohead protease